MLLDWNGGGASASLMGGMGGMGGVATTFSTETYMT
jgi:hypothetical protein